MEDKISPYITIPFSEIEKVKVSDKELTIKHKGSKSIKFRGKMPKSAKRIMACIDGNIAMCRKRGRL